MKKVAIFILLLIIVIAVLLGFFHFRSSNNDLSKIYVQYARAVSNQNLQEALKYTSGETTGKMKQALEISDQEKLKERWGLFKAFVPKDVVIGTKVIEGSKAILRMEHFDQPRTDSKVKNPRSYDTVFFLKEGGEWKIDKLSSVPYRDPTPLVQADSQNPITFFWYAQFHANHTKDVSACSSEKTRPADCYKSWAVLNLDPSLCKNILDNNKYNVSGYYDCASALAQLTGDEQLCEYNSPEFNQLRNVLESQIKFCKNSLSDKTFLQKSNTYTIDSDGDGLTDLQESYFNTSLANSDTDQDGTPDAIEIKNDTNPLGEGKLGDHLLR